MAKGKAPAVSPEAAAIIHVALKGVQRPAAYDPALPTFGGSSLEAYRAEFDEAEFVLQHCLTSDTDFESGEQKQQKSQFALIRVSDGQKFMCGTGALPAALVAQFPMLLNTAGTSTTNVKLSRKGGVITLHA